MLQSELPDCMTLGVKKSLQLGSFATPESSHIVKILIFKVSPPKSRCRNRVLVTWELCNKRVTTACVCACLFCACLLLPSAAFIHCSISLASEFQNIRPLSLAFVTETIQTVIALQIDHFTFDSLHPRCLFAFTVYYLALNCI